MNFMFAPIPKTTSTVSWCVCVCVYDVLLHPKCSESSHWFAKTIIIHSFTLGENLGFVLKVIVSGIPRTAFRLNDCLQNLTGIRKAATCMVIVKGYKLNSRKEEDAYDHLLGTWDTSFQSSSLHGVVGTALNSPSNNVWQHMWNAAT